MGRVQFIWGLGQGRELSAHTSFQLVRGDRVWFHAGQTVCGAKRRRRMSSSETRSVPAM
ncbi:protein of unknown function [Azospirillum baldaniorum]|uniref:Uncharacterized protein n=1 Tax=Azospirillum baldaniorum TaxID=1064539 RepID=A0A9P1NN28_9PROT|nr:protein of unknown function [Azospirillum baldaniorum]